MKITHHGQLKFIRRAVAFGLLILAAFLFVQGIALAAILYSEPFPRTAVGYARPWIGIRVLAMGNDQVASVYITLDGVRHEATRKGRHGNLFVYEPPEPLAPGSHQAEVEVNFTNPRFLVLPLVRKWEFKVVPGALGSLPEPNAEQRLALGEVNRYRMAAGLGPLELDQSLNAAAQSHARYFLQNRTHGLAAHNETPGRPGFTGVQPWERGAFFGYPYSHYYEDMHFIDDHGKAIQDWIDSVYHRFPIMDPLVEHMGYGFAREGANAVNVLQVASMDGWAGAESNEGPEDNKSMMVYPVPGQRGVPVRWDGNEEPDPYRFFPGAKAAGYPITVQFPKQHVISSRVYFASITAQDGTAVPFWLLAGDMPSGQKDEHIKPHFALLPKEDLEPGQRYTVLVRGSVKLNNGSETPFEKKWWFTTAGVEESVVQVSDIVVLVDGEALTTDSPGVYVKNGRVMLPFRALFEKLGAAVEWDGDTRTITATLDGRRLYLRIDNDRAVVEGNDVLLDAAPFISGGRTYVPVRFVAERLGLRVAWDEAARVVHVRSQGDRSASF